MSTDLILGSQWGDEGKGKIIDLISHNSKYVVRFQGGNNAGHTVKFKNEQFALHLLPSGILHEQSICVLGNGVVISPQALLEEMELIQKAGYKDIKKRIYISNNAHLVLPYHIELDKESEKSLKNNKIGTTCRGIGPAYEDKAARRGIRFNMVEDTPAFYQTLKEVITYKNKILKQIYNSETTIDLDECYETLLKQMEIIRPMLCDTEILLFEAWKNKESILFEGAQGAMLDIDHGTYPFVTSSNTINGLYGGAGFAATRINKIIGIVKAYTTRVGSGPFPTEQTNEIGDFLIEQGNEFGTTTGRKRRCGWLDACALKKAILLSGMTDIALTKIDVLDELEEVKICVAYQDDTGKQYDYLPNNIQKTLIPIYKTFKGWQSKIAGITEYESLPQEAKNYIKGIEEILGLPICIISTGPKRESTIILDPSYN